MRPRRRGNIVERIIPTNGNFGITPHTTVSFSGPSEIWGQLERKEQRGENSDIFYMGRTARADILGWIFLGSQKTSQMAACVFKNKNVESSLNFNNLFSNKYPINVFDLTK